MVKCVVCRGKTGSLRRQLCPDCHIWKELTQKYGKDAIIVSGLVCLPRPPCAYVSPLLARHSTVQRH